MATPKCQAKNPLACKDPHCPEKRFNLKFTFNLIKENEVKISEAKKQHLYNGDYKEELDNNMQTVLNWYNELLALSKIDGTKAEEYIGIVKNRYDAINEERKAVEENLSNQDMEANKPIVEKLNKLDAKLKELQAEFPETYHAFYATWEGQQHLFKKLAHYKKNYPNRKAEMANIKKQLLDGQNLHEQQILATLLTDEVNRKADLPIEIKNIIDAKALNSEEQLLFKEWEKHNRTIINSNFVSIESKFDGETGKTSWYLKESPKDNGTEVPSFLVKSLYLLPDSTSHAENWKQEFAYSKKVKDSLLVKDVKSPEYKEYLRKKFDYDTVRKYVK